MPPLRTLAVCIALYLFQSLTLFAVRETIYERNPILYEEATSAYANTIWWENRLQLDRFGPSFTAYTIYALAWAIDPSPSLGTPRLTKALCLALVSPLLFLIAHRRLHWPPLAAAATALVCGLLPVIILFSTLSTDFGFELPLGLAAAYLALSPKPRAAAFAGAICALALLSYGGGLAFLPFLAALLFQTHRFSVRVWLSAALSFGAIFAAAIAWCQNLQILVLGGGNIILQTLPAALRSLAKDLFAHGDSYYFSLPHTAAFGPYGFGLLLLPGLLLAIPHWRTLWPWFLLAATSLALAVLTAPLPGIRRALPALPALLILSAAGLQTLRLPRPRLALILLAVIPLTLIYADVRMARHLSREPLATYGEPFPLSGSQLEQSIDQLRTGLIPLPPNGPTMRLLYSVAHYLCQPGTRVPFSEIYRAGDRGKRPIPLNASRFSQIQETLHPAP